VLLYLPASHATQFSSDLAFTWSLHLPGEQSAQPPSEWLVHLPGLHPVQADGEAAPVRLCAHSLGGHSRHAAAAEAPVVLLYLPASHATQFRSDLALTWSLHLPAGHSMQKPAALTHLPGAQPPQAASSEVAPGSEPHLPGGHAWQPLASARPGVEL